MVTDCRFPNEVDLIHHLGGMVIALERESAPVSQHPSETQILNADRVIANDGTKEDLYVKLREYH